MLNGLLVLMIYSKLESEIDVLESSYLLICYILADLTKRYQEQFGQHLIVKSIKTPDILKIFSALLRATKRFDSSKLNFWYLLRLRDKGLRD